MSKRKNNRIPITDEIRETLRTYQEKTGVGPSKLMRNQRKNAPKGLKAAIIVGWIRGTIQTASKHHMEFVLELWQSIPQNKFNDLCVDPNLPKYLQYDQIKITNEILAQLKLYKKQSFMGAGRLLNTSENVPHGLNNKLIEGWLNGNTKTAYKRHIDYVLEKWEHAAKNNTRVKITKKMHDKLLRYRELRYIPGQILKNANDKPDGLTPQMISLWLSKATITAEKERLDFVLSKCAILEKSATRRIKITDRMHARLLKLSEQTNIGPQRFMRAVKKPPQQLTYAMIASWLNRTTTTARRDLLYFVLKEWENLAKAQN